MNHFVSNIDITCYLESVIIKFPENLVWILFLELFPSFPGQIGILLKFIFVCDNLIAIRKVSGLLFLDILIKISFNTIEKSGLIFAKVGIIHEILQYS